MEELTSTGLSHASFFHCGPNQREQDFNLEQRSQSLRPEQEPLCQTACFLASGFPIMTEKNFKRSSQEQTELVASAQRMSSPFLR